MDSGPSGDGKGLLCLKYFSKAMVTRHSRKDSSKVHKFEGLLHCVYVGMHAVNNHAEGGRCVSVLIFMNKNFVIVKSLTKITKIILLENFQVYGIIVECSSNLTLVFVLP